MRYQLTEDGTDYQFAVEKLDDNCRIVATFGGPEAHMVLYMTPRKADQMAHDLMLAVQNVPTGERK